MAMCSNGLRSHNFNILLVSKDFKEVRKKTASCNIVSHNNYIFKTASHNLFESPPSLVPG